MNKDARNKLIEAATPLFAIHGYGAVSIRDVAKKAGLNSALINYHFGGKEGLYLQVLKSQYDHLVNWLQSENLTTFEPVERIKWITQKFFFIQNEYPYFRKLIHHELCSPTPAFKIIAKDYLFQFYQFFKETLEEGIGKGEFNKQLQTRDATIIFAGLVNYYFLVQSVLEEIVPVENEESFSQQALDIFLKGIR
jgi:TetR/AcrR family transcriptional regulator